MPATTDPQIYLFAEKVIAEGGASKRAIAVLKVLLDKGEISTDELTDLGYEHPPRAVGDVRDAGIPITTTMRTSPRTGRRMAVYAFGNPADIQGDRIGGRSALPKAFKRALVERYGSIDCITGAFYERVLQIDHRVPYRIAGDVGLGVRDVEVYECPPSAPMRQIWRIEEGRISGSS